MCIILFLRGQVGRSVCVVWRGMGWYGVVWGGCGVEIRAHTRVVGGGFAVGMYVCTDIQQRVMGHG